MKLKDLICETPYLHHGTYAAPSEMGKETYISDRTLSRDYKFLFSEVFEHEIKFYAHNENFLKVIGVVSHKKPQTNDKTNLLVFSLRFKQYKTIVNYPRDVDASHVKQVDSVFVDSLYRGFGIASYVYASLVKLGFIVVSDSSQFEDGKELWKKMSREAHVNDYIIHIIDDEKGYVKNSDESVIAYDASNIDDAKIWTSDLDMTGEHILLMMK